MLWPEHLAFRAARKYHHMTSFFSRHSITYQIGISLSDIRSIPHYDGANVQFVHYILIVIGLLLTRWENYCTRRSGSLACLQPIQLSSHNNFHDCTKQWHYKATWHSRIPTTPVKMQTGKRLRSLIATVDWHRRWNPTWTLTNQQGTEAVRESAGLDDTYLSGGTFKRSTFRDPDTSLIAKWYGFC